MSSVIVYLLRRMKDLQDATLFQVGEKVVHNTLLRHLNQHRLISKLVMVVETHLLVHSIM